MKKISIVSAVAVLELLALPTVFAADRTWHEAKSANFTVASDSNEGTARNIAWQLEQFRSAI
ncbi:MAG: hypothetical protein WBD07_02990 [Vicinamibacterales bacterium]